MMKFKESLYTATFMVEVPIMASCYEQAEMLAKHPQVLEDMKKSANMMYRFGMLEPLSVMKVED